MKPLLLSAAVILGAASAFAQGQGQAPGQGMPGQNFIENWDMDGDGQVTVAEVAERRADVFFSFDADEDGFLSGEEYALIDEAHAASMASHPRGPGAGSAGHAEDGMALAMNDVNGDGLVSRDEFVGSSQAWLARLDRNGDGVIDTGDFGRRGWNG